MTHESHTSEDPLDLFSSLLNRITTESIVSLATRARQNYLQRTSPDNSSEWVCSVPKPSCGSFNLVFKLEFSDGVSWILRIPRHTEDGHYIDRVTRFIRSEATTMSFLRKNTSIPIPEVFEFDETVENEIGAPYSLMKFVEGHIVGEVWFDSNGPTPLEERRLRILETVASAMSQLSKFSFAEIGSLEFLEGSDIPTIRQCNVFDEAAQLAGHGDDIDETPFRKIGPFQSSTEYLEALLDMQAPTSQPYLQGVRQLLRIMIRLLPHSDRFVLAHPDLDVQNVLVSEDGTLTALLDWDTVRTVPQCIGYTMYPSWITRDWDHMKYGWERPNARQENSPTELEHYRRYYASKCITSDRDFTTKSHLYEAISIAASSPICIGRIVRKIFEFVFPEDEQDDEECPLYLYETALALAEGNLDDESRQRLEEELKDLLE